MTIRPTTIDDWRSLKAIRLAALRDAPTAFGVTHAAAAAYTDEQWQTRAAGTPQAEYLLAFDGDAAIGIIAGVVDGQGHYNLIAMWVAPTHRGTGVAARLVEAAKARAVARGHRRVVLDVAPENLGAATLYQRQGFVFLPEWEPLASHPAITVQKMAWVVPA